MQPEVVPTDAKKSYILFQPLGPIFHITPFNFPFWLIFKGVIPCIAMGNTVVNKNPASCPVSGMLAEEAFREAGFTNKEFQNLITNQKQSELIISNPSIRGVSFTGSTAGGAKIASLAGKYCKKAVMELGGSDPFIVLDDADVEYAVDQGLQSRLRNAGQVCTAAKRFIVQEGVYERFRDLLVEKVRQVKVGDPMEESTQIGPLAKKDYVDAITDQISRSTTQGGRVILGGAQPEEENLKGGYYYLPTIVEVEANNVLMQEETFGPVFALVKIRDEEEAIKIANDTEYGLAGAVFSRNEERAEEIANQIETGVVYINNMVSSGSELPGGGVKNSGFGREGGKYGAHEFVNIKTVFLGKGNPKAK
jgi:succinate-semialdehyde dehydrogenase/glutarate-semialdehyde dehydrogenase